MTHHQKNLSGKLKEYGGEQKRKKEKKRKTSLYNNWENVNLQKEGKEKEKKES